MVQILAVRSRGLQAAADFPVRIIKKTLIHSYLQVNEVRFDVQEDKQLLRQKTSLDDPQGENRCLCLSLTFLCF